MAWRRTSPVIGVLALVAALAAACAVASPKYGESKFTVTGAVLCQDCTKNWNAYAYNAKPIAGSVVGVTCLDRGTGRTAFHGRDATDGKGVFNVEVPYAVDGCELDPSECLVRLDSSGDHACAVATDFNGGKTGQRPFRPSQSHPGKVAYSVGPYYFTPPMCDVDDENTCDGW